jgi:hypothetical protein
MEPQDLLPCLQEPATGTIFSQKNQIHAHETYFHKIHFNITIPSTPRSSGWSLSLRLSNQNFVHIFHLLDALYVALSNFLFCFLYITGKCGLKTAP